MALGVELVGALGAGVVGIALRAGLACAGLADVTGRTTAGRRVTGAAGATGATGGAGAKDSFSGRRCGGTIRSANGSACETPPPKAASGSSLADPDAEAVAMGTSTGE